jgi:hypothetical protein
VVPSWPVRMKRHEYGLRRRLACARNAVNPIFTTG